MNLMVLLFCVFIVALCVIFLLEAIRDDIRIDAIFYLCLSILGILNLLDLLEFIDIF